ncbi:MAG: hypothetical protein WC667_06910 [Sulfurimonas sp.]|jgi:hypothetical protein
MKKQKFIYSLSVIAALSFYGCGSSTSTNTSAIADASASVEAAISAVSGYSVVVERGAVYDSNVTDANGSVAVQVSDTNNTYVFANEPVFPVTAVGGWIDVDGDGNLTAADVALDINLTSYSNVITPTTTYIADENETVREQKLFALAQETNTTIEELLKVPSEATKKSIIVLNAVYEKLIERDNEHSHAPIAIEAILKRFTEIENNSNLDENATSLEMALAVEEQTMFSLEAQGLIQTLNLDEIEEIKAKKPSKQNRGDENSAPEKAEDVTIKISAPEKAEDVTFKISAPEKAEDVTFKISAPEKAEDVTIKISAPEKAEDVTFKISAPEKAEDVTFKISAPEKAEDVTSDSETTDAVTSDSETTDGTASNPVTTESNTPDSAAIDVVASTSGTTDSNSGSATTDAIASESATTDTVTSDSETTDSEVSNPLPIV